MNHKKNTYCIIMAGGAGVRFWPLSRMNHPKQFLDILGTGKSLIQQTFERFNNICDTENIYVVTNERYKDLVKEHLPQLSDQQILCEPSKRNTAPAIAFASYKIFSSNPEANLIISPSDHIIMEKQIFEKDIQTALEITQVEDVLMTLGIRPSCPDTGYGYIQFEDADIENAAANIHKVKTFTEKPSLELANNFIQSGDFLWNSGIFVWSAKSIIKAFKTYLPEIHAIFNNGLSYFNTDKEEEFISETFSKCKSISIDYGIMEHANNVYVIPSEFGWSDLGSFHSLYEHREKDEQGNAIIGKNVITKESKNCIINIPKDKLAVVHGLDDFIIVDKDNVLLIIHKDKEQDIRQIVNDITVGKENKYI